MSSALPLINIYECTKFNFNQLYFPRYGRTHIHYGGKWLRGDNTVNIQSRIMVLVHSTFFHCHLSINQVSFQSLLYFPRYGPDTHPLWKNCLRGDKTVNIQGMIMVRVHSTSSHCHLYINDYEKHNWALHKQPLYIVLFVFNTIFVYYLVSAVSPCNGCQQLYTMW